MAGYVKAAMQGENMLMEWLLPLSPVLLLLMLSALAKIYWMTRTTVELPVLGLITLQGEKWDGVLPNTEAAVRFELRGTQEAPLESDVRELTQLWEAREQVVSSLNELVEIKAHEKHFELIFEKDDGSESTQLIPRREMNR